MVLSNLTATPFSFMEPMSSLKSRDSVIQRAYPALIGRLKKAGVIMTKHILDKTSVAAMKEKRELLIKKTCKYKLVPLMLPP